MDAALLEDIDEREAEFVVRAFYGSWRGEIAYTPFGETRSSQGRTSTDYHYREASPEGDTGQRLEAELGLYFYQARWYDPALDRFKQAYTLISEMEREQALEMRTKLEVPQFCTGPSPMNWNISTENGVPVAAGLDSAPTNDSGHCRFISRGIIKTCVFKVPRNQA
jgi:RHS repeat-associated protein